MDVSGRGYLTNEKVYKLMEESLRLQKDVFKMKKVIVGWVKYPRVVLYFYAYDMSLCFVHILCMILSIAHIIYHLHI